MYSSFSAWSGSIHAPVETPTGTRHAARTSRTVASIVSGSSVSSPTWLRGCRWIAPAPAHTHARASAASSAAVVGIDGGSSFVNGPLRAACSSIQVGSYGRHGVRSAPVLPSGPYGASGQDRRDHRALGMASSRGRDAHLAARGRRIGEGDPRAGGARLADRRAPRGLPRRPPGAEHGGDVHGGGARVRRRGASARRATTCRGIPVTRVAATLVDLTPSLHGAELAKVLHEAQVRFGLRPSNIERAPRRLD